MSKLEEQKEMYLGENIYTFDTKESNEKIGKNVSTMRPRPVRSLFPNVKKLVV